MRKQPLLKDLIGLWTMRNKSKKYGNQEKDKEKGYREKEKALKEWLTNYSVYGNIEAPL